MENSSVSISSTYVSEGAFSYPDAYNYTYTGSGVSFYINLDNSSGSLNGLYTFTNYVLYSPSLLYNYRSANLTNYSLGYGTATAQDVVDSINALNDNIMDETVASDTEQEMSDNVDRDNTTTFDSSVTSFFSNVSSLISDMGNYTALSDITVTIGLPFTENVIVLHSNMIFSKLNNTLIVLIRSFWAYLFGFYVFKYINKLYISIKSGNILDGLSSNEVITNDML